MSECGKGLFLCGWNAQELEMNADMFQNPWNFQRKEVQHLPWWSFTVLFAELRALVLSAQNGRDEFGLRSPSDHALGLRDKYM